MHLMFTDCKTISLRCQSNLQIQCNPYQKSQWLFLAEIENPILKFIWKLMGLLIAKTILKKNSKAGRLTLTDFKTYYKATTVRQCTGIRPMEQNREPSNTHIYSQNDFWQGVNTIQWGKDSLSRNGNRKIGYPHTKEIGPLYNTIYKNSLKMGQTYM